MNAEEQTITALKAELAELKQENENLKVELACDDARMDKMEKASKMKISKLLKENEKLKAQLEKNHDNRFKGSRRRIIIVYPPFPVLSHL